jgi:hypothetical protein
MQHAQVRLHLLTILNLIGTSKEACAALLQHPRLAPLAAKLLDTMGTFDYEGTEHCLQWSARWLVGWLVGWLAGSPIVLGSHYLPNE